jgi:methylmalonyl-CoA/ethylmalonyl-CoA epimerase
MKGHVLGLDHLGVACRDPKERCILWADLLGLPLERIEDVKTEGVRTWFLDMGGGHLELLEPTSDESPVAKQIEKRGEGIAHMALRVDDIDAVLARLAARGIEPLPPGIRPGAGGAKVAFLHPKATGGVLLELCEREQDEAFAEFEDDDEFEEPFGPGTIGIAYLREPREVVFGVVRQLDPVGIAMEGLDVQAWESWVGQWARGNDGPVAPSLQFFPLARLEKILADADTPDLPSFTRRFEERTGRALAEAFGMAIEEPNE